MGSLILSYFYIINVSKKKALSLPSSEEFSEKRRALARVKLLSLELRYSWQATPSYTELHILFSLEELKDYLRVL